MSLSGKTILVTRAAHQAERLIRLIEERGGAALAFPTIEIVPPESWNDCDRVIDNLYMYDGLVFTSANGVEFFFHRAEDRKVAFQELSSKMILVVGEKTKQSIEQRRLHVTIMPEKFTSFDLAKALDSLDIHGKSFLFLCGNLSNNILQDNLKILGANVDAVIVYRTQKPDHKNIDHLKSLLQTGKIDIITFTSPSTLKNFIPLFSQKELQCLSNQTKIAVIGPVTENAVSDAGLSAEIIAHSSTSESLVKAIEEYVVLHATNSETPQ